MDHLTAFLDWLACAAGGREEPAVRAARAGGDGPPQRIAAAGAAGHVLDFDDTYLPGLAHLSAATAPAALVLAADLGRTVGEALEAYAEGFEAIGALAAASHPALYERGWHPTAVCGGAGAAVAAARLLGLGEEERRTALALALLRAGGLQAGFGSDGKSLQVGMAAATGAEAARLAAGGARVPLERAAAGFEQATGGRFAGPGDERAVELNWIKPWPCCLQSHGAIELAARARDEGLEPDTAVTVTVHPVSLAAASLGPDVATGLEARFSIPYLTALTLAHGPPGVDDLRDVDAEVRERSRTVSVRSDPALVESEAVLEADGRSLRLEAALGSPGRPLSPEALREKVRGLAGERLDGALEDPARPARELLRAVGLD